MSLLRNFIFTILLPCALPFCRSVPSADPYPFSPPDWVNDTAYQLKVEGVAQSETKACANARTRENREFSEHMVGVDLYTSCQLHEGPGNYCDWHYRLRPDVFIFQAREISRKFSVAGKNIHCLMVVEFHDPQLRQKTKEYAAKVWGR